MLVLLKLPFIVDVFSPDGPDLPGVASVLQAVAQGLATESVPVIQRIVNVSPAPAPGDTDIVLPNQNTVLGVLTNKRRVLRVLTCLHSESPMSTSLELTVTADPVVLVGRGPDTEKYPTESWEKKIRGIRKHYSLADLVWRADRPVYAAVAAFPPHADAVPI